MMMMGPLHFSDEGSVCQTCGDEGFINAFVYCCNCLDVPIHRYCLNVMPETLYERVIWYCEQCEGKFSPSKKEEAVNSVKPKTTPLKKKQKKQMNVASLIARTKKVICQEDNTKSGGEYTDCSKWLTPQHIPKKKRANKKKIAASLVLKKKEDYNNTQYELKTGTQDRSGIAIGPTERRLEGMVSFEGQKDESKSPKPSSEPEKLNSGTSFMEKELDKPTCDERDETGVNDVQLMDAEKGVQESYYRCAQPLVDAIWRGSFCVVDTDRDLFEGLVAHISDKACHKVFEEANTLQSLLHLKMQPKVDLWPKSFHERQPSDDKIALYFFPADPMYEVAYDKLVEDMVDEGLAMRATTKNAELLIFTSMDLPPLYWRFQGKYYLWAVFRGKRNDVTSQDSLVDTNKTVKPVDANSPRSILSDIDGGVDMDP